MFKSVLCILFIASLSIAASAIQCSAPRMPEVLPDKMFSSFDLSINGSTATVSKIQAGQTSLNYGISQDQWPPSVTGNQATEGYFEKFEGISSATQWDLTVSQETPTSAQLNWSKDGQTFTEVYDCPNSL